MEKKKVLIIPSYKGHERVKFQQELLSDAAGFDVTVFRKDLTPIYRDLINNELSNDILDIIEAIQEVDVVLIKEHLQIKNEESSMVENFDFAKLLQNHYRRENGTLPRIILPILKKIEDCPEWIKDFTTYNPMDGSGDLITLIKCDAPVTQYFALINQLDDTDVKVKVFALLDTKNFVDINDAPAVVFNRNTYYLDAKKDLRVSSPIFMYKGTKIPIIEITRNPFSEEHAANKIIVRVSNMPDFKDAYLEKCYLDGMTTEDIHLLFMKNVKSGERKAMIHKLTTLFSLIEEQFLTAVPA